jgi:hypothetical protein
VRTDLAPIEIVAIVAADERDTIVAAAHRLSLCLGDAQGAWPVRLQFGAPDAPLPGPSGALIGSLRVDGDLLAVSAETIAARWESRAAAARRLGHQAILIPSLFRHVADAATRPPLMERIRRLNLVVIALSRSRGVQIVDIDRVFALVGARTLESDYRGQGAIAPLVAAHAIAAAILAAGLDAQVPAERQEQAARRNGGHEAIAAIVARHREERT